MRWRDSLIFHANYKLVKFCLQRMGNNQESFFFFLCISELSYCQLYLSLFIICIPYLAHKKLTAIETQNRMANFLKIS